MHRRLIALTAALTALAVGLLTPTAARADDGTYEVRITVLAPDGTPAPGVWVSSDLAATGGMTDANGRAVIRGMQLDPSTVLLTAALDPTSQHLAGPTGWAPTSKTVPPPVDGVSRMTMRFGVGAAVAGTLLDARTGRPVSGASVLYQLFDTSVAVDSDAAGHWLLLNQPRGDYTSPFATGGTSASAPNSYVPTTLGGDAVHHVPGQVTDLGVTRLVPLVLYRGTVTDTAGNAVANARLQLGDVDGDPSTPFSNDDQRAQSNQVGTWSLMIPWSATPHRQLCGYADTTDAGHPYGYALRCVTSSAAALTITQNLVLAAGGAVHGSVTRPSLSEGYLPYALVRVNGEDVAVGFDDVIHRGGYTVTGLPQGTVVVRVQLISGATFSSDPVTVMRNQVTRVPAIDTT